MPTDSELPPIASAPTDQHAQTMFALGSITAEMRSLKEYQLKANGFMGKVDERVKILELAKEAEEGKSTGVKGIWAIAWSVLSLVGGGIITYYATHR